MASPFINSFTSVHVPQLWNALLLEFGRVVNYWPGGDDAQAVAVTLIWVEGVESEQLSPGRYSHAYVQNASLPSEPLRGDAVEKDGTVYDVVRVNALIYQFATIVLQERL